MPELRRIRDREPRPAGFSRILLRQQPLAQLPVSLGQAALNRVVIERQLRTVAFQNVVEYIARNPEGKQLVPEDGFRSYPYTGCLVPGYRDLNPFQPDFWELFDGIYSRARREGL